MSPSGSTFSRPSMLSVQPVSQGGRVSVTAHADSSSASGFSSALNANEGRGGNTY